MSEKICFDEAEHERLLTDLHHYFKADQGYSELEISQKRESLEQVLVPESLTAHSHRLQAAGFKTHVVWQQNLQFVSILAIK